MDRHSEINAEVIELLRELKELNQTDKEAKDRVGIVYLYYDSKINDYDKILLINSVGFKTVLYNLMHDVEGFAEDVMMVAESYRNEKFD